MSAAPAMEPDLLSPQFAVDPHPAYDEMRRRAPAWWDEATSCWYVTTYGEVSSLLRDRRLSARIGAGFVGDGPGDAADVLAFFEDWPMFTDPPEHTAVRRRVAAPHRPSAIRPLRDRVAAIADALLEQCDPAGADLLTELVQPLAVSVTCDLLGIPPERREDLLTWSADIIAFIGVPVLDPHRAPRARAAIAHLDDYLRAESARAAREGAATPQLAALLTLPESSSRAMFAQVLTGGIEPVVGCLGGALSHLAGDGQDLAEQLADGRVTSEQATEEALRLEAPFHFVPRSAVAPIQVGEQRIERGERVALVVAAAHRDPDRYPDPNRFRIPPATRPDPPHLAFGAGAHFCLGAGLARLTIAEALGAVARWLRTHDVPALEVVREPAFGHTVWRRIGLGS